MMDPIGPTIQRLANPLAPIPTDTMSRLDPMPGIQAVLFDVYGTLLTSASGDIDASAHREKGPAMEAAANAIGLPLPTTGNDAVEAFHAAIVQEHQRAHEAGIRFPEVDIRDIWQLVLSQWAHSREPTTASSSIDVERLAVEYEMRVNPVWSMPDARSCLTQLAKNGFTLGLVSNAQFFTPIVLATLLGESLADLRFERDLRFFSYQFRQAKPGTFLYERAARSLDRRGITPSHAIYVGNDMRNDIKPAQEVGFRTALFAGDKRSLRLRSEEESIRGIQPDVILSNLRDLLRCLIPSTDP